MNKNDFKNPLIQSGIVLLVVFLLIAFVAGSGGSQGIGGSITALFSGVFSTIIFLIALTLAITVSILIIIGLFIAAVSIYSVDKGRDLFEQFKQALSSLYARLTGSSRFKKVRSITKPTMAKVQPAAPAAPASAASASAASTHQHETVWLEEKVVQVEKQFAELHQALTANSKQLTELQQRLADLADNDAVTEKVGAIEEAQQSLDSQLAEIRGELEKNTSQLNEFQQAVAAQHKSLQDELSILHQKTSVPEVVTGILSYIDSPEDREKITQKATEAISRGMTYTQIDEFFKASFAPEIYQELDAHPRLTKDFLRSIKKKF